MQTLIILHGWQSSKEKWQKVCERLKSTSKDLEVIVPDIPGFKPETELARPWNLDDYVKWFKEFSGKIEEPFFLFGHSFGGRISIKFASQYPQRLKGLILVSAAGIKDKSLSVKMLGKGARVVKELKIEECPLCKGLWQFFRKFFYRFILRKTDYLRTSGPLKATIKNILNEDLTSLLEKISMPTYIIWGKKDKITPLKDARLMKEKIKNSRFEILQNIGHTPHLENPGLLAQKIKQFLR